MARLKPLERLALALLVAMPMLAGSQAAPAQALRDFDGPVAEASARFGIPVDWIRRVIEAESGGRPTLKARPIRSRAGAMGLMQLMPATWRAMRRLHRLGPDPDDPRDNILAGTAYLRALYDRFGYPGLFAAYNAGPGRYADHLATGRRLPAETVAYIARVAARDLHERPAHPGTGVRHSPRDLLVFRRMAGVVPDEGGKPSRREIFFPLAGTNR